MWSMSDLTPKEPCLLPCHVACAGAPSGRLHPARGCPQTHNAPCCCCPAGAPSGFILPIRDVRASVGAGFLFPLVSGGPTGVA